MTIQTDTYYRGYRLSECNEVIYIYKDEEYLTIALHAVEAKKIIDSWMNAR